MNVLMIKKECSFGLMNYSHIIRAREQRKKFFVFHQNGRRKESSVEI